MFEHFSGKEGEGEYQEKRNENRSKPGISWDRPVDPKENIKIDQRIYSEDNRKKEKEGAAPLSAAKLAFHWNIVLFVLHLDFRFGGIMKIISFQDFFKSPLEKASKKVTPFKKTAEMAQKHHS
ncbi:MAG TPA: hypothetical protein VFH95_06865 [Candidatus Kapabacteria bacterium]|nr:hypothetical protein [Candidatus Kapabacteria bacterium]